VKVKAVSVGKILAVVVFLAVAIALGISLLKKRKPIDTNPVPTKLSGQVVAVFNNTRYAHEADGRVQFVLTAGVDKAYANGAHELEQVKLESFGKEGTRHDIVTADRAEVSDTADLHSLDVDFKSNVVVQTTEGSTVKSNYLHYNREKNVIDTPEAVEFDSAKLAGTCTGLLIEVADERVHLLNDVDLTIKASDQKNAKAGDQQTTSAAADSETPEQKAARKAAKRARKLERKHRRAKALAKADNAASGDATTKRANGGKTAGKNAPSPLPIAKLPTRIRSASALLERKDHRVAFTTNVIVTQGDDEMRAAKMLGLLTEEDKIERLEARGSAYLKQADKAEIKSSAMDFFFTEQRLVRATATGEASVYSLGAEPRKEAHAATIEATFTPAATSSVVDTIIATDNARVLIHAVSKVPNSSERELHARQVTLGFEQGIINTALAIDNARLQIHAAKNVAANVNPAERELSANQISASFHPEGGYLAFAEAQQNAVLKVTPVRAEKGADKKTITAPQMTADFYDADNRLKTFNANGGVKVEIEATVAEAHPPRITTSRQLSANFVETSQDLQTITQQGDFKYNEGDRHAVAELATFNQETAILNLRGKRPMAWDAKARTQANEIDYDQAKDETYARGDVRTTYYSRETTNNSTPFKNTKSPVFITADRADARNDEGYTVYTGNARGWQDDNFVKADKIELYQNDKRMVATGRVESALYSVKKGEQSQNQERVPGFATADRMTYSDTDRLVHYDGTVKARQGTDLLDAANVDVYLLKETNEVERMIGEGNVVMVQPGRRGTGDKVIYTSADDRAVLIGKSARVEDAEKGTTTGSQLTLYRRDDRVIVDNQQGTGRVKSTHRLTSKTR